MPNKTKQLSPEKIIENLSQLDENQLMAVAKAVAQESEKREKDLEGEIKEKQDKLEVIRNGGK